MNSKQITSKTLKKTFEKINSFSKNDKFIINHSTEFLIDKCKIDLKWIDESSSFDFKLELNKPIRSNRINFEILGLNKEFQISSSTQNLIVPKFGINNFNTKWFSDTKKIKGKISELYTESINFTEPNYFRFVINVTKDSATLIFTGESYNCDQSNYSHGLINLKISNSTFDLFRHTYNGKSVLIIESKNKILFEKFQKISKSIIKGIALLTGNWYREKYYIVESDNKLFTEINSIYFESKEKTIITNQSVIEPFNFRIYQNEVNNKDVLLTDNLFPSSGFSNIIEEIISNERINRSIKTLIEVSNNESVIIKSSMYYVVIETLVGLIYNKNRKDLEPVKNIVELDKFKDELYSLLEKYNDKFDVTELSVLNKKIKYLNTPFNADKPIKIFKFYKIKLPKRYLKLIKNRNLFLHGTTPYSKDEIKTKQFEINLDSLRVRLLAIILILKYCEYKGHIKNIAGQIRYDTSLYNKGNKILAESLFFEI